MDSIYQTILAIGESHLPEVLEAIRLELEERAAPMLGPGELPGSDPVAASFDHEVRAQVSAVMAASIAVIGLVPTCAQTRLAVSELCQKIGKVI